MQCLPSRCPGRLYLCQGAEPLGSQLGFPSGLREPVSGSSLCTAHITESCDLPGGLKLSGEGEQRDGAVKGDQEKQKANT